MYTSLLRTKKLTPQYYSRTRCYCDPIGTPCSMYPAHLDSRHDFERRSGAVWIRQAHDWWKVRSETNIQRSVGDGISMAHSIRCSTRVCLGKSCWWLCPKQPNGLQQVKKHMYRICEYCFLQIYHFCFLETLQFNNSSFQIRFYQKQKR